jgi:hypothetical protein
MTYLNSFGEIESPEEIKCFSVAQREIQDLESLQLLLSWRIRVLLCPHPSSLAKKENKENEKSPIIVSCEKQQQQAAEFLPNLCKFPQPTK